MESKQESRWCHDFTSRDINVGVHVARSERPHRIQIIREKCRFGLTNSDGH